MGESFSDQIVTMEDVTSGLGIMVASTSQPVAAQEDPPLGRFAMMTEPITEPSVFLPPPTPPLLPISVNIETSGEGNEYPLSPREFSQAAIRVSDAIKARVYDLTNLLNYEWDRYSWWVVAQAVHVYIGLHPEATHETETVRMKIVTGVKEDRSQVFEHAEFNFSRRQE
jgi:hypothetical protein